MKAYQGTGFIHFITYTDSACATAEKYKSMAVANFGKRCGIYYSLSIII